MTNDEKYMARTLQLARGGLKEVSPNPMVGSVIVCRDRIIGEGYHVRCGTAHAEVNAVNSVKEKKLLEQATLYVTLEPCSHYGKTPPCADMIIRNRIPRVVVGCVDPSEKVAGKGIERLRQAGVEVVTGVLEQECRQLIQRFVTFHTEKRPYILLKWARSQDGYLDKEREGGEAYRFSTPLSSMLVHKLRSEYDAILVGRRTAQLDNPSLTVRNWCGKNPVRICLDRDLRIGKECKLLDHTATTLIFTAQQKEREGQNEYVTVQFEGNIPGQIVAELYSRNITSLLVEGGARLLNSFLEADLWDEIVVETATVCLQEGVAAPVVSDKYLAEEFGFFGSSFKRYLRREGAILR
ncbi:MAG: bifunctional diaminohydroxyphosphoribosylaminopyrimidine deaminase/5-amino-6-(5-phosphoribosylamino)uracil reductase RibD, partial [Bacteroides sp.]|nr:bifunctional diaminohydroxyphosphoribosylaminopyrimidine deaminase/5-amino-6-(5-phosphoribosylamino)uracil reductase RibD [Bacteroides sp.]